MKQALLLLSLFLPAKWILANNCARAKMMYQRCDTVPGVLCYDDKGVAGVLINKGNGVKTFVQLDGANAVNLLTPRTPAVRTVTAVAAPAKAPNGKLPAATPVSMKLPAKKSRGDTPLPERPSSRVLMNDSTKQ